MNDTPSPLELAVSRLPDSLVRTERLDRALAALATVEDAERLTLAGEIIARILEAVEELERGLLTAKVHAGLSMPPDPEPDRGRPLLPAHGRPA